MKKDRKLIIVGDSAFGEIAYEYFQSDSRYEVVAFSVETEYLKRGKMIGDLPVVPFETLETLYVPGEHDVFVAVTYTQLNRVRTRLSLEAKDKGFGLASYISSNAFVWTNVQLGEHCFVFENNVIQPFVTVGRNVVLWSGNHIGHHSNIHDNCFVSSHVVVSGFCDIGENSFLGVNSTISNNVSVGEDNWIGPGVAVSRNTDAGTLLPGANQPEPSRVSALRFFRVKSGQ
jgi:sugar O-acyltransferase (sialic acid O-acetyltransferase NeuD family)